MEKQPIIQITEKDRVRFGRHFACQTLEKIALREFAGGYKCSGCSGSCGTTHFELEPSLKQEVLL